MGRKNWRWMGGCLLLCLAVFGLPAVCSAVSITYDDILSAAGTDESRLSATVDMTVVGSTLTITLTNTSAGGASADLANVLLTGIAFNLPNAPTDLAIASGTVYVASGSTASANYHAPASGDVSPEWGYDNDPLNSGAFVDQTPLALNTAVSGMMSQTTAPFASGSLFNPPDLDGPSGGLLSTNYTNAGGLAYIKNGVVITLNLTGTYAGPGGETLVQYIDRNPVVLSFGSPTTPTQVPEPSTLLLLGTGLLGLGIIRRRRG